MRISDWSSDVCSSDLVEAAREAFGEGRFILKPNRGGKGLGVQPFVDADALAAYVASPAFEEPRDGIHLLQEHVATAAPILTRAEFVGGPFPSAVAVDTTGGFHPSPAALRALPRPP